MTSSSGKPTKAGVPRDGGSIQEVMDGDLDPFIEAKLRGKVRVKGAKNEED